MSSKYQFTTAAVALALIVFAFLSVPSATQASELTSFWTPEPITVDGKVSDWDGIPTVYLDDEGVAVGICNDSANVYIMYRFRDAKSLRSIRMTGLTIWLDANGKEKKEFGIRYNGGPSFSEIQELSGIDERDSSSNMPPERRERMMQRMQGEEEQFSVIYRGKEQRETIPTDGSRGPAVSFGSSDGFVCYEFAIPIQTSDYGTFGIGAQPEKKIGFGSEWGGRPERGGPDDGVMRMDRGGGRGGDFGGERRGGRGGSERRQAPEKHEFWFKTELAPRPSE
jgi:hypothetical protein